MKNILVVIPMNDTQRSGLQALADEHGCSIQFTTDVAVTDEQLSEANLLIGNVPPARLKTATKLDLVQLNSAGTDGYTAPGVLPQGAALANATGAYGLAIAEHMLAMVLSIIKKLPEYGVHQRAHEWSDEGPIRSIWGSRTLVVGMGDIGSEFAKRMHAMGSTVVGIRRTAAECPDYCESVTTFAHLDQELPLADFVACAMPGTPETFRMFDRNRLQKMKSDAIFINVGRGTLADPAVLAEAVNEGIIGGVCVDVTDPEPLPADNPLWSARNTLITPHISGGYHLEETRNRILQIASDNIRAICEGTPLRNRIL